MSKKIQLPSPELTELQVAADYIQNSVELLEMMELEDQMIKDNDPRADILRQFIDMLNDWEIIDVQWKPTKLTLKD